MLKGCKISMKLRKHPRCRRSPASLGAAMGPAWQPASPVWTYFEMLRGMPVSLPVQEVCKVRSKGVSYLPSTCCIIVL